MESLCDAVDTAKDSAFVLECMRGSPRQARIQARGCKALTRIVPADDSGTERNEIVAAGGLDAVMLAVKYHPDNSTVVEAACGAIGAIVCDHEPNQATFVARGGLKVLLSVLMKAGDASRAAMAEATCEALVQCTYDNPDAQVRGSPTCV